MRDKELKLEEFEPSRKLRAARCHGIQGEGSGEEKRGLGTGGFRV
jgi:hypothetical protein